MTDDRTTLQDVAEAAGVHHTTVSRSLKDDPQISPATRKRIQTIAERMGYEPDPMLQALARYRSRRRTQDYHETLAWLTNHHPDDSHAFATSNGYLAVASRWAAQKGYRFEAFDLNAEGMSPAKIRRILTARGIRGILLPPQWKPGTHITMDFSGFSLVTIGNTLKSPDLHRVAPAQYENSRVLASRLFTNPRLRVGFYFPSHIDERADGKFSAGFWRAQQEIPLKSRIPVYLPPEYDEGDFQKWFCKHPMDVLVTTPQPISEWLGRMRVRIPQDVHLAFPGDAPTDASVKIQYWVSENWGEIYHSAVDFLISQLERNSTGIPEIPRRILVQGTPMKAPGLSKSIRF
jgi:LacI family transcriptional regulator/LacI family repressor for deo operon, udp, cdd, tsx, nupC, and nupG